MLLATRPGYGSIFKHYRIGAYIAYVRDGREASDAERFRAKAQKVGAKRLLIVNVLADEAALECRAQGTRC